MYPDGYSETLPSFNNLRMIENTTYAIPIGTTVARQLHMGSDAISNVASRCGGLVWGYGVENNIAAGSDSVLVTRIDASTWHVVSQPAPHNLAWCKTTGELFAMPVDFTVVSSLPLHKKRLDPQSQRRCRRLERDAGRHSELIEQDRAGAMRRHRHRSGRDVA